jgi:hypothetical protein
LRATFLKVRHALTPSSSDAWTGLADHDDRTCHGIPHLQAIIASPRLDIHGQKMDIMEPKWQNLVMTGRAMPRLVGRLGGERKYFHGCIRR